MHFLARNQYTPLKVEITFSDLIVGSIAVAGSAVKWARDQLGIIKSSDEIGKFAGEVDGSNLVFKRLMVDTAGVIFVTAFSGLWAPYWRSDVQGTICRPSISRLIVSWDNRVHNQIPHLSRHPRKHSISNKSCTRSNAQRLRS